MQCGNFWRKVISNLLVNVKYNTEECAFVLDFTYSSQIVIVGFVIKLISCFSKIKTFLYGLHY